MPLLNLQCTNCLRIFSSGIYIEGNSSVTFSNCTSSCPFCGSSQSIPDGTFKDTVEGFIGFFKGSNSPLKSANEIFKLKNKFTSANTTYLVSLRYTIIATQLQIMPKR